MSVNIKNKKIKDKDFDVKYSFSVDDYFIIKTLNANDFKDIKNLSKTAPATYYCSQEKVKNKNKNKNKKIKKNYKSFNNNNKKFEKDFELEINNDSETIFEIEL